MLWIDHVRSKGKYPNGSTTKRNAQGMGFDRMMIKTTNRLGKPFNCRQGDGSESLRDNFEVTRSRGYKRPSTVFASLSLYRSEKRRHVFLETHRRSTDCAFLGIDQESTN